MTSEGYFSQIEGRWVSPEHDYESDTDASLKAIVRALKSEGEKPDEVYDAVERLLFKYNVLVRHGSTRHDKRTVLWHLTEHPREEGRALISFYDNGNWFDDCYSDEVPLWLLLVIVRQIQRRKPLGDQEADETISLVRWIDVEYHEQKRDVTGAGKLNRTRYAAYVRRDDE
jgi:hypothetical protein